MTSTTSKNWLSIVSKHRAAALVGLVIIFIVLFAVVITPKTGAETIPSDPGTRGPSQTVQDCRAILPTKVDSVCDGKYVGYARTVATHHCKDATVEGRASCVTDKARAYFKRALAKDKTPASVTDFKKNLDAVLDAEGGSRTKAATGFGVDENPEGTCESGDEICNATIESTVDPAACTAAANANQPLPQGCPSDANQKCTKNSCDLIKKYVNPAIEVVTAIFGLIAIASLIMGGIQYSASAGDPQKVTEAKKRISNTLLAIIAYLLLFSFLQFLIPGGLFKT